MAQVSHVFGAGLVKSLRPAPQISVLHYSDGAGVPTFLRPAPFLPETCAIPFPSSSGSGRAPGPFPGARGPCPQPALFVVEGRRCPATITKLAGAGRISRRRSPLLSSRAKSRDLQPWRERHRKPSFWAIFDGFHPTTPLKTRILPPFCGFSPVFFYYPNTQ